MDSLVSAGGNHVLVRLKFFPRNDDEVRTELAGRAMEKCDVQRLELLMPAAAGLQGRPVFVIFRKGGDYSPTDAMMSRAKEMAMDASTPSLGAAEWVTHGPLSIVLSSKTAK